MLLLYETNKNIFVVIYYYDIFYVYFATVIVYCITFVFITEINYTIFFLLTMVGIINLRTDTSNPYDILWFFYV